MPKTELQDEKHEGLRTSLEKIDGVRRVLVDLDNNLVSMICDASASGRPLEVQARAILETERSGAGDDIDLEVSYLAAPQPQRRIRFVQIELERPQVGWVVVKVDLEWGSTVYTGSAEGEGGPVGELRLCAQATLRALETTLDRALSFQLVGVKATRIFDSDLVAVVVHSDDAPDHRLMGVSLVGVDTYNSAALSVLNATNRVLGNYLQTPG